MTADIEKAFLMVSVDSHYRDVLRFLWVDDVSKSDPNIRVFRYTRVVFGVSSSPFLLNATIKFHLESFLGSNEAVVRCLPMLTILSLVLTLKRQHSTCTLSPRTCSGMGDSISVNLCLTLKRYNGELTVEKV